MFVEDPDSIYRDVSDLFGFDFLDAGRVLENIDQAVPSAAVTLRREHRDPAGVLYSLSPTVSGSLINRNADDEYARFLKAGRGLRVFMGWDSPDGADDYPADYLEVFRGKIDEVDWKGDDGKVELTGRGLGAWLLDKQIEIERIYGDADGIAMETVMQQILDDNESTRLGPVVLFVPVSPGVLIKEFKQERKSVLEAVRDLAFQIGWDVRYKWQDDGSYRLTFYQPDRAKVDADWTLGPGNYFDVVQLKEGDADVRNKIVGITRSREGELITTEQDSVDSISEYDVRYMEFTEDDTSEIDTLGELASMVGAALADLQFPFANQEVENDWFPVAELGDLGEWLANGKHYDTDQKMAVVQVRHEFNQTTRRTFIQCRGSVIGGMNEWLRRGHSHVDDITPADDEGDASKIFLGNFREIERQPTFVRFGWQPSPAVAQIWVYERTQAPSDVEPWPPTAAQVEAGALPVAPRRKLTGDTGDYLIEIPPDGQVTYVQFEPRRADLTPGDVIRQRVFASEKPPTIETLRQAPGPTGLYTEVAFDIIDAKGLGGELRAWVNAASDVNADPDAAPDGTVQVVATPEHVDGSSLFDLTGGGSGALLNAVKVHPGKGKRVYFEFVNAQGVTSGQVSLTLLTNSSLIDEDGELIDGAIKTALQFAAGITPVQVLSALPVGAPDGTVVLLTTDGQLYRRVGGAWTLAVPAVNISGQVVASQIADAAINTAKFAAGIRPVRILGALPGAGDLQGDTVFLTTDNKLYRWTGAAWVATVPTADLTGTIGTLQIANDAVTTAKIAVGNITTALIAAANITTTLIADNAITTPKLIANAVTAAKIAAGTITANEIAALTIVAANIAASTITGAKIAAGTITATNILAGTITATEIAADTITAGQIAAGAISTSELAAGAVIASKIAAGTITANEIAALTITAANIAAATITGAKIAATTITSNEMAANSIIAGKIAAGAINASAIIVDGVITAAKLSVSVLSGITADLGVVVAGKLQSVNGHSYIDLNATGTQPFIYHETAGAVMTLSLLANGNATFGGTVSSTSFTATVASFTGSLAVAGSFTVDADSGIIFLDGGSSVGNLNFSATSFQIGGVGPFAIDLSGGLTVIDRILGGGNIQFRIDDNSTFAGLTPIAFRWDPAGGGTGGTRQDTIQVGAANSGGAGKRALFINN